MDYEIEDEDVLLVHNLDRYGSMCHADVDYLLVLHYITPSPSFSSAPLSLMRVLHCTARCRFTLIYAHRLSLPASPFLVVRLALQNRVRSLAR